MSQELRLVHEVDRAVHIFAGEHLVLTYHYGRVERYPYCHPVNLPGGGPPLTLCRPFDHDWHLGLYFAWKYVNGYNVWEGADSGEPFGRTRHGELGVLPHRGTGAGLWHELEWVTAQGEPLLHDRRTLIVRPPGAASAYTLDWAFRFTPLVDEVVLERKVEWGGYAGLSIRLPRSFLRPQVRNSEGHTTSEETHRARARWTDYAGWIDGLGRKAWAGVAMLDHPRNPRHPTPWLTYDRPGLQFLNAAFLRDEPYVLRRGETLHLAYRLLVHWDAGDPAVLEAAAQDFARRDPWAAISG